MRVGNQARTDDERVLRLASDLDPIDLRLSPQEGYLLSRIDGHTSWETLRQIGGLPPGEIDRCIEAWVARGWLEYAGKGDIQTGADPAGDGSCADGATAPPPVSPTQGIEVDASLDLSEGLQKELLELAADLQRPYHAVLGVPRDADVKAIKKAYFAKSKRFHPDRYFRRNTGPFAALLELCFKRLLEAYELLSDPATRAEVEKSQETLCEEPTLKKLSRAEASRRLRRRLGHFSGGRPGNADRKRKAKAFFEAGVTAYAAERWLEAAGSVRLAIAFDPGNQAFRERFVEVQRRAHEERAKQLVKLGEAALDMRHYGDALGYFEEAFQFRPYDGELAMRAAKIAWQSGASLKKAKEFALAACEVDPEVGAYHRVLGQIYKAANLAANARRELEAAVRIDSKDKEARAELRSL